MSATYGYSMVSFDSGFPGLLGFFGSAVLAIVVVATWVILASSRFVQGGIVERPERVPQLYGYTVCLVSMFWALASGIGLVGSALTLNAPEYTEGPMYAGFQPSVSSFEAFRTTYEQSRRMTSPDPRERPDSLGEGELRRRYVALREDRIRQNIVQGHRSLVSGTISLIVALALFTWHWRWLRRVTGASPVGPGRVDV